MNEYTREKPKLGSFIVKGLTIIIVIFVVVGWYETQFSIVQSRLLKNFSDSLFYSLEASSSDRIVYPRQGPFNIQRGYTRIPEFIDRLSAQGYQISKQTRFSDNLLKLAEWEIMPPYREPAVAGLIIKSKADIVLLNTTKSPRVYDDFHEIPELVVNTLLLLEDRKLTKPAAPSSNPVVDWKRLYRAAALYGINQMGIKVPREGGSTLATQLEKFRYSAEGKTKNPIDKLRQMAAASIKVYSNGYNTHNARKNIIIDYLNAMPLSATPGFGDVYGLGQGLYAWFGKEISDINRSLKSMTLTKQKIEAYKQILTLLTAIRAPSYYLRGNYRALETRVNLITRLLEEEGIIGSRFASLLRETKITLNPLVAEQLNIDPTFRKAVNLTRNTLGQRLNIPRYYELNKLFLEANTTIDALLQTSVMELFDQLKEDTFLEKNGLKKVRLLKRGDPKRVIYSFLLYEKTGLGNKLRVLIDNEADDFDLNTGMKLDLGSTAKLRTLVHYLEIVHELYEAYHGQGYGNQKRLLGRSDPITQWVSAKFQRKPETTIEDLLTNALEKKYSANPGEKFFTGGGIHRFRNFNPKDNNRSISVREATIRSVNLVYIRLMRDIVKFHRARLPYDTNAVLKDQDSPLRREFLKQAAEEEAKTFLTKFYRKYRLKKKHQIIEDLLTTRSNSLRHLTILYFAWHDEPNREELTEWLLSHSDEFNPDHLNALWKAYKNPNLTLSDFGYLLGKHPLELWSAGKIIKHAKIDWSTFWDISTKARQQTSQWLFKTRNHRAQINRLMTRIERDAFSRMTSYWQKAGYPFSSLVPSYATALGSSADRPEALANLVGILFNHGVKRPTILIEKLQFAKYTPYHTVLEKQQQDVKRILPETVAKAVVKVLQDTVHKGTARRVSGAFKSRDGASVFVGGKTGSGDNRIKTFDTRGNLIASRPLNRTATFVFVIGNRFFGVITAHVRGESAGNYGFTSSLPVALLKHLAPTINQRL